MSLNELLATCIGITVGMAGSYSSPPGINTAIDARTSNDAL
jgi:hypothetical protein